MRRINVKAVSLDATPVGSFVEVLRDERSSKESKPQYLPVEVLRLGNTIDIVATDDGLTTAIISPLASFVTVTSSNANKQISLPLAVGGKIIRILGPTNGCELISVVTGDKVNTVVVGATNEAALVAGTLYTLRYNGTDNWVMTGLDALGAVETPVVPNTL